MWQSTLTHMKGISNHAFQSDSLRSRLKATLGVVAGNAIMYQKR